MKRLLGVVLVLFMACIPMELQAEEKGLSFEYTGQRIEIDGATLYYSKEDSEFANEAFTDCGNYRAYYSDGSYQDYEITPKFIKVNVSYNKNFRNDQPEEEKYLCECDGDYEFKLRTDTDGNFILLDNYQGNYAFQFEPKNAKDVEVIKTQVTHPDVECVYSEDGIKIYSDIDQVKPILLKDVGEYNVCFEVDDQYYESIPFKVTILPKMVQLKLDILYKYYGQEDPSFEYDDYILSRGPGEDIGDYKLTVQSKSKNYKYEIIENVTFSILEKQEANREHTKHAGASEEIDKKEETPIKTDEVKTSIATHKETTVLNKSQSKITTGIQTKTFPYSIALMFSLLVIFIFIFKFI